MMKLLICRRGWSATGGAERYLQRFAKGLLRENIPVALMADPRWPDEEWPDGKILRIASTEPEAFTREVLKIKAKHPGVPLFSMERLPGADVFRAGDGLHSAWLARQQAEEGPLVSWFRRHRKMHRQILMLEARLFQDSNLRVVANSRMVAEELVSCYNFESNRIAVIPNGYDAVVTSPSEAAKRRAALRLSYGIPDDAVVFLFVGSGWKRKGAQILVDAFRQLNAPNAWLILLGKGRVKRANHARIHVLGSVKTPEHWLIASDVFALPTLYDPFSNACLEAAAYGLPVITSDANGFRDVIDAHPDAGEIVPVPRNVQAWSHALRRWLDPGLRMKAMSLSAEIRSEYTIQRNVTATLEFIRKNFEGF